MAPRIVEVTPGCVMAQFSATCAGSFADLLRDFQQEVHHAPVPLRESTEGCVPAFARRPSVCVPASLSLVLPAEDTAGERTPRAQSDAKLLSSGDMLPLDIALDQRIFQLKRGDRLFAFFLGEGLRASDVPCGRIRKAVIADFSLVESDR